MTVKTMLPALSTLAAAALCLCLGMGGCAGGGRTPAGPGTRTEPSPPPFCAVPAPGKRQIGRDGGLIGRLEERATVTATLYRAEDARGEKTEVELLPGTWLVPASTIAMPEAAGGGEEHDE